MKILYAVLLFVFMMIVFCKVPTDPIQDYSNCNVEISGITDRSVFTVDDTVKFDLKATNPHLIDSIKVSFNEESSIKIPKDQTKGEEIFHIEKPFLTPDTIEISIKWVKKNNERDSLSRTIFIVRKVTSKTVYWKSGVYKYTVYEGDTLSLNTKPLYTVPSGDVATLNILTSSTKAKFIGDSLFVFTPVPRDSGNYTIPVIVSSRTEADTSLFDITVLPRYCTLSVHAESGTVKAQPSLDKYRWGDIITLTATPNQGFKFSEWSGGANGITSEIQLQIIGNTEITALFLSETTIGCVPVTSDSLNAAIKKASPSSKRPGSLCPQEGFYENGTVKVSGTVRFIFQ
jgi:Divergent InlB B-repeat domain